MSKVRLAPATYKRENLLNDDTMKLLGFTEAVDFMDKKCWRIKVPYYSNIIQVTLGEYESTNPNCGVLSLFYPKETVDVYGHGTKRNKTKKVTFPERTVPIAWYVDTCERLHLLIQAITHENLY